MRCSSYGCWRQQIRLIEPSRLGGFTRALEPQSSGPRRTQCWRPPQHADLRDLPLQRGVIAFLVQLALFFFFLFCSGTATVINLSRYACAIWASLSFLPCSAFFLFAVFCFLPFCLLLSFPFCSFPRPSPSFFRPSSCPALPCCCRLAVAASPFLCLLPVPLPACCCLLSVVAAAFVLLAVPCWLGCALRCGCVSASQESAIALCGGSAS